MTSWVMELGWRYGLYYFLMGLLSLSLLVSIVRAYVRTTQDSLQAGVADVLRQRGAGGQDQEVPLVVARRKRGGPLLKMTAGVLLWGTLALASFRLSVPAYYLYRAQTSVEGHDYEAAAGEFRQARIADAMTSQIETGYQQSVAHEAQHTDTALDAAASRVQLHGNEAAAHNDLANLLMTHNQVEQALQEYRTALSLNPDYALVHNNLGNALKVHRQQEDALREYRRAIDLEPDNPVYHCSLARLYTTQGKAQEAILEYRTAVKSGPEFIPAYLPLAVLLHSNGQRSEAVGILGQLLSRLHEEPKAAQFVVQIERMQAQWRAGK